MHSRIIKYTTSWSSCSSKGRSSMRVFKWESGKQKQHETCIIYVANFIIKHSALSVCTRDHYCLKNITLASLQSHQHWLLLLLQTHFANKIKCSSLIFFHSSCKKKKEEGGRGFSNNNHLQKEFMYNIVVRNSNFKCK